VREIFHGGTLAPEEFIGFLLIIFQLMAPIKDISSVNNRIQEASVASDRIFQIIDAKPDIYDKPNAVEKNTFDNSIELKNVNFSYNEDRIILNNVNLKINKNEKIAVVGQSGVGKSTLIDIIPRFYDAVSGEILIDGINNKDIKLTSLRN